MKKSFKKIITSTLIFFIILLLSVSIILAKNTININNKIDKEKIYYEIKYFDSKIIYISNLLDDIEKETTDWKKLQKEGYSLYNYWNSVILDLNSLNIDKKDLTDFGKYLDKLAISIKYKNKEYILNNLIGLYSKLIIYADSINYNNYNNILISKYNLLLANSIAKTGNWTLAHEYILKSSKNIYKLLTLIDSNEYTQYNINQTYISVKELENLINIKDIDIFYIKYKIAINNLDNLTLY